MINNNYTIDVEITLRDHLIDSIVDSFINKWSWILPGILLIFNIITDDSLSGIHEGAPFTYIFYYLWIWFVVSILRILFYMMISLFGPNKAGRGKYSYEIGEKTIVEKAPTGITMVDYSDVKEVKVERRGVVLKLKNGSEKGYYMKNLDLNSRNRFADAIREHI